MRGQLDLSMLILLLGLVVLAVTILVIAYVNSQIEAGLVTAGLSADEIAIGVGKSGTAIETMNTGFALLTFGMGIVSLISAFAIRSHPVFFILMLLINIIIGVIAPTMSNIVHAFSETAGISTITSSFNILLFITDNFSFIIVGLSIVVAMVMYAKGSDEI